MTVYFEEFAIVNNAVNDILHVVRMIWIVGDNAVERIFQTVDRVIGRIYWWFFQVVLWHVGDQFADQHGAFFLVNKFEVRNTRFARVNISSTQIFS